MSAESHVTTLVVRPSPLPSQDAWKDTHPTPTEFVGPDMLTPRCLSETLSPASVLLVKRPRTEECEFDPDKESDLHKLVWEFLGHYKQESSRIPFDAEEFAGLHTCRKVFNALAVLLTHVPSPFGASIDDLNFVSPLDKNAPNLSRDTNVLAAKVFARRLKRNPHWEQRIDDYRRTVGGEASLGGALSLLQEEFDAFLVEPSVGEGIVSGSEVEKSFVAEATKLLTRWTKEAPSWAQSLRQYALRPLSRCVVDTLRHLLKIVVRVDADTALQILTCAQEVVVHLVLPDEVVSELKHSVSEQYTEISFNNKLSRLDQAGTAIMRQVESDGNASVLTWDVVSSWLQAVQSCYNSKKPSEYGDKVFTTLWCALAWAAFLKGSLAQVKNLQTVAKEVLVDGDLKEYLAGRPSWSRDLANVGKAVLSLAAAADFSEKMGGDFPVAKTEEYAGILLAAVHKFAAPIVVESPEAKAVIEHAEHTFASDVKEKALGVLQKFAGRRLAECRDELNSVLKQVEKIAGGSQEGKVWSDDFGDGDIMEHFRATLDKIDTKGLEKLIVKLDKVVIGKCVLHTGFGDSSLCFRTASSMHVISAMRRHSPCSGHTVMQQKSAANDGHTTSEFRAPGRTDDLVQSRMSFRPLAVTVCS